MVVDKQVVYFCGLKWASSILPGDVQSMDEVARRQAQRELPEHLRLFVVVGRCKLDTCQNCTYHCKINA